MKHANDADACQTLSQASSETPRGRELTLGAKGLGVLPLFPIFRHFFHFHKNPSSFVISVAFSRENCFPQKPENRPKIAKHTKHETLTKTRRNFP